MCEETDRAGDAHWLFGRPLDRRDFTRLSATAAALALLQGCGEAGARAPTARGPATRSRSVMVTTQDGHMDAWFVHPATGRHPAVIMWPDIAGLRDAYRTMATRLAQAGYAVIVPNQYYRSERAPIFASLADWMTPTGPTITRPMIAAISPLGTARDAVALVDWLDAQPVVDRARKVATSGYCIAGPYTLRSAAARPDRIGAVASFHGGGLVTAAPDSPHLAIARSRAAMLFAIAANDDARSPGDKDTLRAAADAAHLPAEIEVYPAQHGWCTIDAPVYDAAQAERAWARQLALFSAHL